MAHESAVALRYVATQDKPFDAVTLDLRMPGGSGQLLYTRLAAEFPDVAERVIFVTGDIADPQTQKFLAASRRPVLTKPLRLPVLAAALAPFLTT